MLHKSDDLGLRRIQKEAHAYAKGNGFWDEETQPYVEKKLLLVVSEVTEAMEEVRNGKGTETRLREKDGKPEGFGSELADIVIRVADLAEAQGVDLSDEIMLKMTYNKTRPFRHGKAY